MALQITPRSLQDQILEVIGKNQLTDLEIFLQLHLRHEFAAVVKARKELLLGGKITRHRPPSSKPKPHKYGRKYI